MKKKLRASFDCFAFFYEGLHPAENSNPALAVGLRGCDVARESGVSNFHHCSGADAAGALVLQAMDIAWFKFPPHDRVNIRVTRVPGLHQQARWINFEILAFHAKLLAITAHAFAEPLSAGPNVTLCVGQAVKTFLPPPFCGLRGIGDGCEHAGRRSGNEYFGSNGILVGSDLSSGHLFPRFKSFASFDKGFQPAKRRAPAGIVTLSLVEVPSEPGVPNPNQRSRADFMRSSGVQAVNFVRLELPANHGCKRAHEISDASVDQQTRRINLKVFAFKMEVLAVSANTFVRPFAADAKIRVGFDHSKRGHLVRPWAGGCLDSPPLRALFGIGNGFEDASWRSGDENLRQDRIVIWSESCSCHF